MTWQKIQSDNPAGKPSGSHDRRGELRSLLEERSEALLVAAIEKAMSGNVTLMKAFLGHLMAPAKGPMNTLQRCILIAVAVIIAGMTLYPPFYYPRDPETSVSRGTPVRHGYDWLLSDGWGRVEVELLLVQFLVVGVIGLIAYVLCADKKQ